MNNDIERVLYSEEEIQTRIGEMAKQIEKDYADKRVHHFQLVNAIPFF